MSLLVTDVQLTAAGSATFSIMVLVSTTWFVGNADSFSLPLSVEYVSKAPKRLKFVLKGPLD